MAVSTARPAIFFDRDGTLVEDRGYLRSPSEVVFYPDALSELQRLKGGYLLFILTNQRGVGLGVLSQEEVEQVNQHIVGTLSKRGVTISAVYSCPHTREQGCECIKPKPYFLLKAAKEFNLDLERSFVVGDHPSDVETARKVGAEGIFLLTGHGRKHAGDLTERVYVGRALSNAVDWILLGDSQRRDIRRSAEIIREGGVVAFPTETVYGLGADAFSPLAVARIFEAKRRPRFDPVIVHIASHEDLERLVTDIPANAKKLTDRCWPGPLTVVLPKREAVPDVVTAGLPTVAVRMPRHPVALSLIQLAERPIAAPSANPFGYISPTTASHVRDQLGDAVDFILDGGPCEVGVESTIVSFAGGGAMLLRPGGIPLEEVESIIGKVETPSVTDQQPSSPGRMPRHYAPRTSIVLDRSRGRMDSNQSKRKGWLGLGDPENPEAFHHIEVLSKKGDLREAASNLFAAIRRLDALNLDLIVAEPVPEVGLGRAIMDRLRRASHRVQWDG